LFVEEPITVSTAITVVPEPSSSMLPTVGRELTVRALLAAGCSRTRIGRLLGMDRKTAARLSRVDVSAAMHNGDARAGARARLEASEQRGITLSERDAATAWLDRALLEAPPAPVVEPSRSTRLAGRVPVARKNTTGRVNGKATTAHPPPARPAGLAPEQLHVLVEQQQRILRRSLVIDCAVKADALDPPTLRDVVAEFMSDVIAAARRIGAILQPQP
jgi:hypothetical protein